MLSTVVSSCGAGIACCRSSCTRKWGHPYRGQPTCARSQIRARKQADEHVNVGSTPSDSGSSPAKLWSVPWDIWDFIQLASLLVVVNFTIPYAGAKAVAAITHTSYDDFSLSTKETLMAVYQAMQLAATAAVLHFNVSRLGAPLPPPWFRFEVGVYPTSQAIGGSVAAAALCLLYSSWAQSTSDGSGEWQSLFGGEVGNGLGFIPFVTGALLLAPINEELLFRGFILPSLTRWCPTTLSVGVSALAFAAIHPGQAVIEETIIGACLGVVMVVAEGNLYAPILAHALYNAVVIVMQYASTSNM